jgi:hypothetical protein
MKKLCEEIVFLAFFFTQRYEQYQSHLLEGKNDLLYFEAGNFQVPVLL